MIEAARLRARLESLRRELERRPAKDGLGGAIVGASSPLLSHAAPALGALDRWLARPGTAVPAKAMSLIGLGPGLTPSGDDYFAGVMLGLRLTGRCAAAGRLWRRLKARAGCRTSAISRVHLAAAARGEVHEALRACAESLLAPRAEDGHPRWDRLLDRLDAVGHNSGRDGLAGVVAVARALSAR